MTYHDALRFSLQADIQVRMPLYILNTERLMELARTYVPELGYTPTQKGSTFGTDAAITSGHVHCERAWQKTSHAFFSPFGKTGHVFLPAVRGKRRCEHPEAGGHTAIQIIPYLFVMSNVV